MGGPMGVTWGVPDQNKIDGKKDNNQNTPQNYRKTGQNSLSGENLGGCLWAKTGLKWATNGSKLGLGLELALGHTPLDRGVQGSYFRSPTTSFHFHHLGDNVTPPI